MVTRLFVLAVDVVVAVRRRVKGLNVGLSVLLKSVALV
jgi:hypothetical protein